MPDPTTLTIPPGHCVTTTYGALRYEMVSALMELRAQNDRSGLTNVAYKMVPGTLVDKARNDAVRGLLADPNAGWLLFIDGDMVFPPDALLRLVQTAYGSHAWADVVGAYCPLRGDMALPTIDSGTGTWESHFPNSGVIEVMRTGAAFLLTKRHVYQNLKDPWYALRVPMRPIDALAEVDNYARIKFDGRNPFRGQPGEPWERLLQCAEQDPSAAGQFIPAEVGEDSGACDRMRAAGFRIVVDTGVVTGHVDTKIVTWEQHKSAIETMRQQQRYFAGVGG